MLFHLRQSSTRQTWKLHRCRRQMGDKDFVKLLLERHAAAHFV